MMPYPAGPHAREIKDAVHRDQRSDAGRLNAIAARILRNQLGAALQALIECME